MAKPSLTSGRHPLPTATKRIFKALSIFSGVQSITILVSVIRTKLVALWIGPAGVGLQSLYLWTMQLIATGTQFNINQSAVREVSQQAEAEARATRAAIVRRVALALGIGGALLTILLSPILSLVMFGDYAHTLAFICLASMLPLGAVTAGENALMQGYERLSALARATALGAVVATAISVPLYYLFRVDAIVPVVVLSALCNCVFALVYRVRTGADVRISTRQAFSSARDMLSLGIYLTASSLAGLIANYIFLVLLNRFYGEATVGIYNAGTTLLNSYIGIIFTAISMEFYPRLSRVASSAHRTAITVSHESMISLAVVGAVVIVVICCGDLIIDILYTAGFYAAKPFVAIGVISSTLRAPAWCMAFTMLARGDGRAYLLVEGISEGMLLILNIVFFRTMSFTGLGIAYVLMYILYFGIVYIVYRRRYRLHLAPQVLRLTALLFTLGCATWLCERYIGGWLTLAIVLPPYLAIVARRFLHHK